MSTIKWVEVAPVADFPENGGIAFLYNDIQIAIYNFTTKGEWFATQNLCPHKKEMALARGIIGDLDGEPKVACPFHKKNFSLHNGSCLSGDDYKIETYPVKITDNVVYIGINEN